QDGFLPQTQTFEGNLTTWGIPHEMVVVPGVPHSHILLYAAEGVATLQWHAERWNEASLLDAGTDQDLQTALPAIAPLAGPLDDPQGVVGPSPAFTWSMVSGPGIAVFDHPGQAATTVHLPAAGTYQLRLEASGNSATLGDVVRVTAVDTTAGLALYF